MSGFTMALTIALMKVLMMFVNEAEYTVKVANIPSMDRKHPGFDLKGWEYRSLLSSDSSYTHRYYYYPSNAADAPVFLLIHGLNLDGRTFLHLTGLADRWQLVAYDLPEQCPRYDGKIEEFTEILCDFLACLGADECSVGGASFGGALAIRLAAEGRGIKVNHLVLMSTTMLGSTEKRRRQSQAMAKAFGSLPDYKMYWAMERIVRRSGKDLPKAEERDVHDVLRIKHPQFYRQVVRSMVGFDVSVYAQRLTLPVLLIMGDKDGLYKPEQGNEIRQYIAHAEYGVVPGGTHSMVYMRGEKIAERIRAFCDRQAVFSRMD